MSKIKIDRSKFVSAIKGDKATIKSEDARMYYKNSPEDITNDVIDAVNEYNNNYCAKVIEAFTDESEDIFKKNKGVETIVGKMPYIPKGGVAVVAHREKTTRIPGTENVIVGPRVRATITTQYKSVTKSHIQEMEAKLKKAL